MSPSNDKPAGTPRADFSGVTASVESSAKTSPAADFSGVTTSTASTAAIAGQQTHTVARGDTLSSIARQHLGKASAWPDIFELNRDILDDPDRIQPGQVLKLPARPS